MNRYTDPFRGRKKLRKNLRYIDVECADANRDGRSAHYNVDVLAPLPDGKNYSLKEAVQVAANDPLLQPADRLGIVVTFYDHEAHCWRDYRYIGTDTIASTFVDPGNWECITAGNGEDLKWTSLTNE